MKNTIDNVSGDKVLGTLKDFCEKMQSGAIPWDSWQVFRNLSKDQHRLLSQRGNPFLQPRSQSSQKEIWQEIYARYFGIESIDISLIMGKTDRWSVYIHEGLTMNRVLDVWRNFFEFKVYGGNLDAEVTHNDRTSEKSYGISVASNMEADPEFANMSEDDLVEIGHVGITLLERMVLEVYYFHTTGKHLDIENFTLCIGSRNANGFVPFVDCRSGVVCVDWCHPSYAYSYFRSRAVVSE